MNSAFFEFNVAVSGMLTAKSALANISHNISNAATPGYSRQVAKVKAGIPLYASNGRGMVGTGSDYYGVGQIRDTYIDKKYWSYTCTNGEYSVKRSQLCLLETIFNDLSDTGLTGCMTDFFNEMSELTFSAGDSSYASGVIDTTVNLVENINSYAANMIKQQQDVNDEIYSLVETINSLGNQISILNKEIFSYEIQGQAANDLRDQRALLVDELSGYVNVEVKEEHGANYEENNADLRYKVLLNGQEFIDHFFYNPLTCVMREELADPDDAPHLYNVYCMNGSRFNEEGMSGELKGLLDIRDGDGGITDGTGNSYKGIPYYMDRMNLFVRTLAMALNDGTNYISGEKIENITAHREGYNMNGETNGLFLSYKDDLGNITDTETIDYEKMTAMNFSVAKKLLESPENLAIAKLSDTEKATLAAGGNVDFSSNNEVILGFMKLKDSYDLFAEGNIYDFIVATDSALAIDNKQATNFKEYYTDIITTVDNQRIQMSGVSLNEEMTNLIKYQQVYQASARIMNTMNQLYDRLINEVG